MKGSGIFEMLENLLHNVFIDYPALGDTFKIERVDICC